MKRPLRDGLLPPSDTRNDRLLTWGFGLSYFSASLKRFGAALTAFAVGLLRIAAAFVFLMVGVVAGGLAYHSVLPMETWVDYQGVEIVPADPPAEELVRIHRIVSEETGVVAIRRSTELQEATPNGLRQYCLTTVETAASAATNPVVISGLMDYVGERCARLVLPTLEGHTVHLQILYQMSVPPFSIDKSKAFYLGPFVVRGGILRTE